MSSLRTRRSLSTSSKNDDRWRTETSASKAKQTLRTRVQAFFSYEPQRKLHDTVYRRWKTLLENKTHTWELRTLIDIVKNLPLRTVRVSTEPIAYKDRLQFLFPFTSDMEGPESVSSLLSVDTPTPVATNDATSVVTGATPAMVSTAAHTQTPISVDLLTDSQSTREVTGRMTDPKRTLSFSDVQETQQEHEVSSTMAYDASLDEENANFNAIFFERFEDKFKEHFTKEMDLYSDIIDKRLEHVTNTLLDNFVNTKIESLIQSNVTEAYANNQATQLEHLVQDHLDAKIGSSVESLIQTKLEGISQQFTDTIFEKELQPRVKSTLDTATKELLDIKNDSLTNIRAESNKATNAINNFKSTLSALLVSTKQDLKESSESAFMLISKDTSENLELIAHEAKEALTNFSEVSTDRINQFKRNIDEESRQALTALKTTYHDQLQNMKTWFADNVLRQSRESAVAGFKKGDEVWYTRDDGHHEFVEIIAVHTNINDEDFYTIELPSGQRTQAELSRLHYIIPQTSSNTQPHETKPAVASRWSGTVDAASILRSSHLDPSTNTNNPQVTSMPHMPAKPHVNPRNPYATHRAKSNDSPAHLVQHEPTPVQTRDFHKYFKAKLESNDNVLTFYQQLHSQGRNYNILLIDLKDIQPDVDLCPPYVSPIARTTMKIALYQKFQDADCLSSDYTEGQNFVETFGGTSDGYSVLYQMIRLVHPHLIKGRTLYNLPTYSNIGDIFKYANMMRNYILVQEIKNRYFTEKEQSEMFLHNIDDAKLASGRAKALSELDIATMNGDTAVKVSNLRMDNLPITVLQYSESLDVENQQSFTGTVRALNRSSNKQRFDSQRNHNNAIRQQYNQNQHFRNQSRTRYVALQCVGCGMWGHPVSQCRHVPKIAIALDYIKAKPRHVEKLVTEFKRVNDKTTKKGTIRFLLSDGSDPESYLEENDIDIPMEDVPDDLDDQQE